MLAAAACNLQRFHAGGEVPWVGLGTELQNPRRLHSCLRRLNICADFSLKRKTESGVGIP